MPRPLRSFTTFSRPEKMGLLVLSGLLMILILVRGTLHFFIRPHIDQDKQQHLQRTWQQFQATHSDTVSASVSYVDNNDDSITPIPASVNINTADSATLVRLRGIGPVTAHKILEYRSAQPFTEFEKLRKVCRLSAANAQLLQPHITFIK